ncbi:DNA repair protein RAD5B [Cardamine amara subsp. amara]|uniref:DNA repair protein RAD5B n=1 Tax=Cardamine amara subsp. amara TaxID=228776 RepID=A0ABD0ZLH6_CARAN
MAMVDDTEMPRIESEAVSSSDDVKIVADTQDFIDESSLAVRTATGVRISPQFDPNGSKSDPLGVVVPVKEEVISDGFSCVNKDILESDSFRAVDLEIRVVKEEPDLNVENQEDEMIIDSIAKPVVKIVSSVSDYDCNVKVEVVEPELLVENLVVVKEEEEMIIDSIAKSVVETVSRGLEDECVNAKVKVKEESGLGTKLEEEVIRVQEGLPSEIHGFSQESKNFEQDYDLYISGKRRKMEIEPSISIGVKSCILAPTPLRVVKAEILDNPEVIDLESEKQEKMEEVEEKKDDAVKVSSQVKVQKPMYVKKETAEARKVKVEDGDFPVEKDWYLVGRSLVTATSTSKGRKLEDNEIVNFTFSSVVNWKVPNIVRFSTKRCGEIGRLPMEWSNWAVMLLKSGKVKLLGRCVAAPPTLTMMQEIMLYVSFYIHSSIFTDASKSTWRIGSSPNVNSTLHPLLQLFKHLTIKPYQKAEFTPEELDSRKRRLNLEDDSDERAAMLAIAKRRKGCPYPEQNKDEEDAHDSYTNRIVGDADSYNLEEMEAPSTLTCSLRPYQKQALYWMSESEKGIDVEKAAETLHPCWEAYRICDERAPSIYVNIFSGEATIQFPTATQMARGGILADAMGLGKTVMTIALILARPGRGNPENEDGLAADVNEDKRKMKETHTALTTVKAKGGTLIICPMALLSQWKDELETHSKPDTVSVLVYYGGDRTHDAKAIASHDVVLTTYGVLTSAYKQDMVNSIFHRIDWYRIVLDEAHTIKSWKTQAAKATFELSSHCRWCLTGTPLQNKLEDLYSLLCFLHVEPWCNWAWWSKLIQKPYENGDPRGLKLIKAILRPLMLRRTKETRDKEGSLILELPPTDVQVIECEQSEAERDFYTALFKRSKVQFDQFVAQGKVLHNYANILELLLRLRQCCNHPFLVMSRADSQQYADLDSLAKRFLDNNSDSVSQKAPSLAYIEEVIQDLRDGNSQECPICLESADDPILTPCAHRMCRECLLSSWRSSSCGLCPICRTILKKTELISCPTDSIFRVDVVKNWKESSKVSELLKCLEKIKRSGSGEKSIVFSQWTSFLDLLEIPLRRKGIEFLRFDGKLAQKAREKVLKEFNETKQKTILLMSLKAGGVGLNLTAASSVFLMDPWWNPAVEEQAIMRIHRIGQKRTVYVRRFIVKDTVEERMQQVQARKQRMIAGALTDEEVRSARLEELKMLFR